LVADGMAWRNQEVALSRDPAIKTLAQSLSERRKILAQLTVSAAASDPNFTLKLTSARGDVEDAERQLAGHSATFQREQQDRAASLQQIDNALPDASILVSYVRYGQVAVRRIDPRAETTESYAAFVLNKNTPPRFVSLGAARPIDDMVATIRGLIEKEASSSSLAPRASEQQYRQAGEKLRHAVWDPVAGAATGDARMIFVVPDGMLHFVNLAALPVERGRYLIETGAPLHRLMSERDLMTPADRSTADALLALGGADYGSGNSARAATRGAINLNCRDISKVAFASLPATLPELREVSRLFHEGEPSASVIELTGAAASKSGFMSRAESQSVLHLATHAFFIPAACARDQSGGRNNEEAIPSLDNPLLRSGLVFSGARNSSDRVLTAQEIASLSLTGTQWAVLSACDSGMGELQDGEGVLGLQRAFQVAGARTVVMSLWPVDDESTSRFMRNLYRERFREHQPTAESMHQATLQTLRQMRSEKHGTHPFYWAGFVASGDWR
jgi:CHAT domain-containing protein